MKNMLLIGTSIIVLVIIASAFMNNSLTGFVIIGGGGAQGIGEQATANPKYGTIYGSVVWQIKESDNVVATDIPDEAINVYLIPIGKIVNWEESVTCDTFIIGALNKIDADGEGTQCIEKKYESPTAYICAAKDTDGEIIKIYKTITDMTEENIGCFAAKIKPGEYDLYM